MGHADAFLAAILAEPDDDAPRLIYADWLEERGDPRGAFIRVQCALERLDPADPRRPDLEDEARSLLDRHEEEWTAPLHGVASGWRFRRGFVAEATLTTADVWRSCGADPFASFPIQKIRAELRGGLVPNLVAACPLFGRVGFLDVSGSGLRDRGAETLLAALDSGRLTGLDLRGNGLENRAVRALTASPLVRRLTWLDLGDNHGLGLAAARALAQAPAAALRFLGLSSTNIGVVGLRDLLHSSTLAGLTALQAASIGYYGVAGAPAADLAEAPLLYRLTSLDLGGFAAVGGLSLLLRSPRLGRLTSLGLANCGLRDDGVRALADSPHLAGLAALDLSRNGVGPDGARELANSPDLADLTALRLGHNPLRDKGVRTLAESPYLTRLTVLDLGKNGIGGPGLHALAASPNLDGLTTLDLGDNFVGLDSVKALAASPHLGRLTSLRLDHNRVEPAAARVLAASPHLGRLTALHLDNNDLGDEGLRALLYSPHLTRLSELSVRFNNIGKAGADALAALLAGAPRWARLRKLDLTGNPLSGHEQRVLQERFGARVEL